MPFSDAEIVEFKKIREAEKQQSGYIENAPQNTAPPNAQQSVLSRIAQGMRDPINAGAVLLPKALEAATSLGGKYPNQVSNFLGSEASRVQDINRANEAQYAAANTGLQGGDYARIAGNVLSPVNAAIAARVPFALSGAQAVKSGVTSGAIGGVLGGQSDVNDDDYWLSKTKDAAIGGVTGGAISGALSGAARIIRPETNEKVAALLRQGVTPTIGDILGGNMKILEEKLQSLPITGDAIRSAKTKAFQEYDNAALNRAVAPLGEKISSFGREGFREAKAIINKAYDDISSKVNFVPDRQFSQDMARMNQLATGLAPTEQNKFQTIIGEVFHHANPANGHMTGETFQSAAGHLAKKAKDFSSSQDPYQRELGEALNAVHESMLDTMTRANPMYADRLKAIRTGYANFARLRQASSSTAAGSREGLISPAQLASAVRAQDKSVGKGASATGDALLQDLAEQGTNVLGSKYPDSGTAGRLAVAGGLLGGANATGTTLPALGVLSAGALPYLPYNRELMAKLLTQRSPNAGFLADEVRKGIPYISGASGMMLTNNRE